MAKIKKIVTANSKRARAQAEEQAKHDPFASRVPDHSVLHRYARCISYPEWGVGTVSGIYFTGDPTGQEEVQQWARVRFSHGICPDCWATEVAPQLERAGIMPPPDAARS